MNDGNPNHRLISKSEIQAPSFPVGLFAVTRGFVMIFPIGPSTRLWSTPPEKKKPIIAHRI